MFCTLVVVLSLARAEQLPDAWAISPLRAEALQVPGQPKLGLRGAAPRAPLPEPARTATLDPSRRSVLAGLLGLTAGQAAPVFAAPKTKEPSREEKIAALRAELEAARAEKAAAEEQLAKAAKEPRSAKPRADGQAKAQEKAAKQQAAAEAKAQKEAASQAAAQEKAAKKQAAADAKAQEQAEAAAKKEAAGKASAEAKAAKQQAAAAAKAQKEAAAQAAKQQKEAAAQAAKQQKAASKAAAATPSLPSITLPSIKAPQQEGTGAAGGLGTPEKAVLGGAAVGLVPAAVLVGLRNWLASGRA